LKKLWKIEKPFVFKEMIVFLLLFKDIKVNKKTFKFANLQNEIKNYFLILKRKIKYNIQII
jgi:hypothetical protein